MDLILSLLQQLSVYLVIAYLLSKTPIFMPLLTLSGGWSQRLLCYGIFSIFCILGTYLGLQVQGAIANTRAIGAVMGGLIGGPMVGFFVGLTGGLHRYFMGGFTDLACMISTTTEGLFAGLLHAYMIKRGQPEQLFRPKVVFMVMVFAEALQMMIILLVAQPFDQAFVLVSAIALPMTITNALGGALFMSIIEDRKIIYENYSTAFSNKALKIAQRSVGILDQGFNNQSTSIIAQIVYEETGVGAVSITDCNEILAFVGIGADHHLPGTPISSSYTREAIDEAKIIYANGYDITYRCSLDHNCRLGSVLVIPVLDGNEQVIGTIKLYEPKQKLFSTINLSLGEGIAKLISNQVLSGRYQVQQNLLIQAELKLLRAQINPHFLFNTLNTINAVIKRDPDKARALIGHLSQFFRRNLRQQSDTIPLEEELEHINDYLKIELARFGDRLTVNINIDPALLSFKLPPFSLQPLIENAIKHGTSSLLACGNITLSSIIHPDHIKLVVTDNAGNYRGANKATGLGLKIVDKRLKNRFGQQYGLLMSCEPQQWTNAIISMPLPSTIQNNKSK